MKRKMWMRALALLTATVAVMTDSGMVYAAQTVENVPLQQESAEKEVPEEETPLETEPVSEEPEAEPVQEEITPDTEQDEAETEVPLVQNEETEKEPETVTEEYTWEPVFTEAAEWEEKFSFEQPQIGEVPEEESAEATEETESEEKEDFYVTYYGDQLEDELASELYQGLTAEDQEELTFENVTAEEVEKAAQAAFDAFLLDETEWTAEELKDNCNLQIHSVGTVKEDGGTEWNISALWTLPEKEDPEAEEETVTEEEAGKSEESEEQEETEEQEALSQEETARLYRKQCMEEEIPCVLMVSVEDEEFVFQNAVCDEDGIWQLVDPMEEKAEEAEDPATTLEEIQETKSVVVEDLTDKDQKSDETSQVEAEEQPETTEPESQEPATADLGISTYSAKKAVPQEPVLQNVSVTGLKNKTYTGKAVTQKVKVKDTVTGKNLKQGKDYTISYENNVNAGTATLVVRGVSGCGHTGVLRVNFTIEPQTVAKKVKGKVLQKKILYTGAELKPSFSLTYNKMTLTAGKDYQVSYANNIAKGTGQIIVTGQGNYTGKQIIKFKITGPKMKDASVSLNTSSTVYNGATSYPGVTVTYAGKTCKEGTDYIVKYPKKLKAGKNSISVRGKGNFSGSVKLTYTLSKASMEKAKVSIPYAWQFTKKKVNAVPTSVKVDGVSLTLKKDYTVKYYSKAKGKTLGSMKEAGEYQILLIGKGSYTGTKKLDICVTSDQKVLSNNYDSGWEPDPEPAKPAPADTVYTQNKVPADHDYYMGYYEQYKITSKKGIQGTSAYTEDLGVQHVLLNVDMADLISTTAKSGYVPYTYKGKTYYFGDLIALKDTIYYLHGWGSNGENPYGANHARNVTLVLLMSWKDELSYLIHPSARKKGAAPYYALNMQDAAAKDTFEALFRYMGEWLGQYKTRVSNWTLGNEVNSCKEWNYSGNMSLNQCVENYAKAFQLLYKGVKRTATSSRVFISLDHCWTASVAGHSGKSFLDQFAAYMAKTAPDMQWNVNYHPYSDPLGSTNFWSNTSSTSNSSNTKYISMRNINVLTDYLSQLESKYGKASGSIRVILGEFGYSANAGNTSQEQHQAAALGYGYYIAMANSRIDSYIIRAYQDAPEEGKLKLGLRTKNDVAKESYQVYKYLDTSESETYMNKYLSIVGLNNWSQIPGFNTSAFNNNDF